MSAPGETGIVAVFAGADELVEAARRLHRLGLRNIEAYTPYPIEGVAELLEPRRGRMLPLLIFAGAVIGAAWGYFIQYWDEVLDYPLNVGGRPHNSWPAFIVSALEIMLLFAVAAGFFGLLARCRLPRLYHPIFAAPAFERASCDRFVLCVDPRDPLAAGVDVRAVLRRCGAVELGEVPA